MKPMSPDLKNPSAVITLAVSSARSSNRHDLRSSDRDLADLSERDFLAILVEDGDLGRRDRQADRAREFVGIAAVAGRDRSGLREAVSFRDHGARQLLPALRHPALNGHAAAEGEDQVLEVELLEVGIVEEGVEEGVEPREHVDRVLPELRHEGRNVARVRDQDVMRTLLHAHHRVHRQGVDVVERERADIGLLVGR